MIEVFKFYVQLISELLSRIWGGLNITSEVTYLHLVVATFVIVAFISIATVGFSFNGINTIKYYKSNEERSKNK